MRSKILTTSMDIRYRRKDSLPNAFTEQGVYMLMTAISWWIIKLRAKNFTIVFF